MYFTGLSSFSRLQIKSSNMCCRSVSQPVESVPLVGLDCRQGGTRDHENKNNPLLIIFSTHLHNRRITPHGKKSSILTGGSRLLLTK
jgi:hypothetical protein